MQLWSANKNFGNKTKNQLFTLLAILSLPLWVGMALFMLFPNDQRFEDIFQDSQADGVSISYLQQLLKSSPGNFRLRHKLATQLKATGQFNEAWKTLDGFTGKNLNDREYRLIQLLKAEISAQLGFAGPTPEARQQWYGTAITLLEKTPWENASAAELKRLTVLAPALDQQSLTADFYLLLAEADSLHRSRWLNQAALWKLAASQGKEAGNIYSQMASQQMKTCDNCHGQHQTTERQLPSARELRKQAWSQATDAYLGMELYQNVYSVMQEAIATMKDDPDTLLRGINIAQSLEADKKTRQWLQQVLSLKLSASQLKQAQALSTASGNVDLAIDAAERRLPMEPQNPVLRRSLAQLYQWSQRPDPALKQWQWVLEHSPDDREAFTNAWQLAEGLFHYQTVVKLLDRERKKRTLGKNEFDGLINALIELGQPEMAEDALNTTLKDNPDNLKNWLQLTTLLEDQQKLPELASAWQHMHDHFELSQSQFLEYMQILQTIGQLDKAVTLLNQQTRTQYKRMAQHEDRHNHKALWKRLADLAWRTENDEIAARAITAILKDDPNHEVSIERYLALNSLFSPEQQLKVARQGYRVYKRPFFANTAMELAAQLEDWHELETILKDIEPYENLTSHPAYWLSKARLSLHKGDVPNTIHAYEQALTITGPNPDIIASYLWFLLSENQLELIKAKINQWDTVARNTPALWPVFAGAWNALGKYRQAIDWYQKALQKQPDDPLLNLALADTLIASGWISQGWQIRKKTIAQLYKTKQWLVTPQWHPYHIQSRVWLVGLANSVQWLQERQGVRISQPALWLTDLSALLLQGGNLPAAMEWLSQHQQQGKSTPFYQLLAVALQGDNEALEPLLAKLDKGPERVEALAMLGHNGEALTVALGENPDTGRDSRRSQLTEQAVALTTEHPSGWRVSGLTKNDDFMNTRGQELTLAHRFNRWHLQLVINSLSFKPNDPLLDNELLSDQQSGHLQFTRLVDDGYWRGYTDMALRNGADRYGLGIEQYKQWNHYTSTQLFADYQGKASVTSQMEAFGRQNRVGVGFNYSISGRDRLLLSGTISQFNDRYQGKTIGFGYDLKAAWEHRLLYRDPQWLVTGGMDWQDYRRDADLQDSIQNPAERENILNSLLPQDYHYFYISNRWQHGNPGALNAGVPSPRWLLGVTLGYLLNENSFNYNLEAGLGWRMFGNDELSLMAGYDSSTPGSSVDGSYRLNLSYQHRFGQ